MNMYFENLDLTNSTQLNAVYFEYVIAMKMYRTNTICTPHRYYVTYEYV